MDVISDSIGGRASLNNFSPALRAGLIFVLATLVGLLAATGCDKGSPTTYATKPDPVAADTQPTDTVEWDQDSVYIVQIETTHATLQGMHEYVDVTMNQWYAQVGGYDLLLAYDASGLSLRMVSPGPLFTECGWEYFDYRFGPFGNCEPDCPSGMVRVVGIAELNNGDQHPDTACAGSLGADGPFPMFTIDFLVTDDRTWECAFVPVRFFWMGCNDNSIAYHPPDDPYAYVQGVARYVFENPRLDSMIADSGSGFPTYTGVQSECFENDPGKPVPVPIVDFINGGVQVICADSIDARGDINLNGISNEIVDAVVFSRYFVQGLAAFAVDIEGQIAASDVNANGEPLEVADLVYLIRIITGDALPYPRIDAEPGRLTYSDGVLSIDRDAGAAYLVLAGDVTPRLVATNMEMSYSFDGTNTRVLVWKVGQESFYGEFLAFDADILSAEMATYEGAPIDLYGVYDHTVSPLENHPNPFTDVTTITCLTTLQPVEYRCTIFNAAGTEVARFVGESDTRMIAVTWDAHDLPAGQYSCRMEFAGIELWHTMLKLN